LTNNLNIMNLIKKKSTSFILNKCLNVIWYIEWIACLMAVITFALAGFIRQGYSMQLPITFKSKYTQDILDARHTNLGKAILNADAANLSIHVDANWQNILMIVFGYGSIFAVIVIITYQLRKMSRDFQIEAPFQQLSLIRIKYISFVLISYTAVQWLFVIGVNQFIYFNYQVRSYELTYDFNFSCLITGIILLLVTEIFKAGIELEEEKKLVI
jgi:hypothetical protein